MVRAKVVARFSMLATGSIAVFACGPGEFSLSAAGGAPAFGGAPASAGAGLLGGQGGAPFGGAASGAPPAGGTSGGSPGGGAGGAAAGASVGGFAGASQARVAACQEACASDVDCRVSGFDEGFRCNTTTRRCERFANPCRADAECLPEASLWLSSCASDAECILFSDDVCVDAGGGVGRCARLAPGGGCVFPAPDAISVAKLGGGGSVLVCANTAWKCDGGACRSACRSDRECNADRNGSVCDLASGTCRCVRNEDCGGAGVSVCDLPTGFCRCANAADCTDVANTDACIDGRCGCSAASACNVEREFSGTTYVCE